MTKINDKIQKTHFEKIEEKKRKKQKKYFSVF